MSRIHKLEHIYKEKLKDHQVDNVSDFIQSIFNADITKGKYIRFLIEAFLNDKFLEEDLIGGVDSTVGHAISLFDKHKHKLPEDMRSVFKYTSPGDLWNSVKQYQGELSGKELKKEEQEQIYRETEFIYKDEKTGFQIVSPLTKESAKWWGKGTRWCTSAENNNLFWDYAEDSPLLILLMPASASTPGNGQKLQLWNNNNDIQFMDEADNIVSLEYIEQHWNILEPVCLWLNSLYYIPKKYLTLKICKNLVQKRGNHLLCIPEHFKTKTICELAVKQTGNVLCCVPKDFITEELCNLAIQKNGEALQGVPEEYKTKDFCEMAVKNNGWALRFVPDELRTKKLCELAVQQNGDVLKHVPLKLRTKELCNLAIKSNDLSFRDIPEHLKTEELYKLLVENNGMALRYFSKPLKTKEFCEIAVKQNGLALNHVPMELKTKELCNLAIKKNGKALVDVPDEFRTKELCKIAVEQNGLALENIPEELKTPELCAIAVKQNGWALDYVPDEFKDELKHCVKDEAFELPIEQYQKTFQEIKTFFPMKDVSLEYHNT